MSYPLLNAFLTMFWFFIWILWIFLVIRIIIDIFRSRDLGGWAKAGWLVLVIVLPFLGVFTYLIVHGGKMAERETYGSYDRDEAVRAQGHVGAHRSTGTDELGQLAELRNRGILTEEEYQRATASVRSLAGRTT